ncbi:hypothetical protein V0288_05255 [Pannus brasiliensis CCIBt3594]|uniref:Uncharacterized protein n=1 Tax=Pannus brasiliensis CCIBt3594 TaxID=1427578 RepID=A0AAW9QMZ6_9CHRO
MTESTRNKLLDDLVNEIKPYAQDLGLYALTVGQVLSLSVGAAERAKATGKESQFHLSKWLLSQIIENHPETKPIIHKYDDLLSQLETE